MLPPRLRSASLVRAYPDGPRSRLLPRMPASYRNAQTALSRKQPLFNEFHRTTQPQAADLNNVVTVFRQRGTRGCPVRGGRF